MTWRADLEMIKLASPRALIAEERALLDFLLAGPLGDDRLRAQAATVGVTRRRACDALSAAPPASSRMPQMTRTSLPRVEAALHGRAQTCEGVLRTG